jgi:hypothetical protein
MHCSPVHTEHRSEQTDLSALFSKVMNINHTGNFWPIIMLFLYGRKYMIHLGLYITNSITSLE